MVASARLGLLPLLARILRTLLSWSPVWIAALLIWQFTERGLRPAQAEQSRLDQVAPEVIQRHARSQATFQVMAAEAEAWEDPVYRERQRRLRAAARADQTETRNPALELGR